MTLEELLAWLPSGVGTLVQGVDWLIRSQVVKLPAAIPLLCPILAELDVEAISDKDCPTEAQVNTCACPGTGGAGMGRGLVILCLPRLTVPQPLSDIAHWTARYWKAWPPSGRLHLLPGWQRTTPGGRTEPLSAGRGADPGNGLGASWLGPSLPTLAGPLVVRLPQRGQRPRPLPT